MPTFFKDPPVRNKKYTNWVKTLPCCDCGAPADDPHHIIGTGCEGGMGTKACDLLTMPMCRECHTRLHEQPLMWEHQWKWVAKTLQQATKEGVIHELFMDS